MKKYLFCFLLLVLWVITSAQTPGGVLEQAEQKVIQLLVNAGQAPSNQGGIGERIDRGLTQLLALVPPQASDVVCVPLTDCARLIQKAIDAATDGSTVTVNTGQFVVASPIRIYKPLHLKGQGKARTVLTHKVDIGYGGGGGIIHIGKDAEVLNGVTLSDFAIRADRVAQPKLRTTAIRIRNRASNVVIRDMHFEAITSSVILIVSRYSQNIAIINNTVNEYYEQFVEISAQFSSDFLIANNTVITSKGHPDLGATEPFPVALTPGHSGNGGGLLERVWIVNNVFEHRIIDAGQRGNTVGVMLSQDQASLGYQFGFNEIYIIGNKIKNQGRGVRVQLVRTSKMPVDPSAYVTIQGNEFGSHSLLVNGKRRFRHHQRRPTRLSKFKILRQRLSG
jgi:Pectate lyase superfamily protein